MTRVLFDHGKVLGDVSEWSLEVKPPAYKEVLGKTVLLSPANDEVTFVSPKPVGRKSKLKVIEDEKVEMVLQLLKVIGGTQIIAKILSKKNLSSAKIKK